MAHQDRLQPSLLDRLTDDDPHLKQESRERRVISIKKLREAVVRDLGWLLNTGDLGSVQDLTDYPRVAESVLNYGLPSLAGQTASSVDVRSIERALRQSILNFEPRILRRSLKVRIVVDDGKMSHNAVIFDIEGQLWAQPAPLSFMVRTEVDLETGGFTVQDQGGRGMA